MRRLALAAGTAAALGSVLFSAPTASGTPSTSPRAAVPPAAQQAADDCDVWMDTRTYGARCSGSQYYRARAYCTNGRWVNGPWVNNWRWSYAYCSSIGSYLEGWEIDFA